MLVVLVREVPRLRHDGGRVEGEESGMREEEGEIRRTGAERVGIRPREDRMII